MEESSSPKNGTQPLTIDKAEKIAVGLHQAIAFQTREAVNAQLRNVSLDRASRFL